MAVPVTVIDAFADAPFGGNPAGVVVLDHAAPETWMQAVAAELNLAETAFLVERPDGDHDLRWFTPTTEIDLCGHATLASAHRLGGARRFHTRSGVLTCEPRPDGTLAVDLPATTVAPTSADHWPAALGLAPGRVVGAAAGGAWTLVEVATPADVEAVSPDRGALLALGGHAVVVADAVEDDALPFDSVSRVFVPAMGIDEDPVTGAAHCVIGPWLAARHGRLDLVGRQASRRGGTVGMEVRAERVVLVGRATTVWRGELLANPDGSLDA